jgi:hypothetical protein
MALYQPIDILACVHNSTIPHIARRCLPLDVIVDLAQRRKQAVMVIDARL